MRKLETVFVVSALCLTLAALLLSPSSDGNSSQNSKAPPAQEPKSAEEGDFSIGEREKSASHQAPVEVSSFLPTTSQTNSAPSSLDAIKEQIELSASRAGNMEQTLLAMAEILSAQISERPDMNFWDSDVVAFPFEIDSVKAHFFVSGRDETLAYGCEIQVPITEPFFHEGAYRREQTLRSSYSPFHRQLIVILSEPIDFQESEHLGVSLDSTVPLGMRWGRDENGERCYLSYWENKSIHADLEGPCYAGIVNTETVNSVIYRLSQLERQVRND